MPAIAFVADYRPSFWVLKIKPIVVKNESFHLSRIHGPYVQGVAPIMSVCLICYLFIYLSTIYLSPLASFV